MAVLRIAFLSSTVLELFSALGVALVAVFVGFTLLGEIGFGSWGTPLTLRQGLFLLLIAPSSSSRSAAWHDRAAGHAVTAELDALDAADRVACLGLGQSSSPLPGPIALSIRGVRVDMRGQLVRLPDLALRGGDALALTGPSGAGRGTALAAIAGLTPIASGRIDVCGLALSAETADAWRARLAMVPQRPHFPDVPLGDWLDTAKTGRDPWPSLRKAGADGIVARLPGDLQTRLGEAGGGVSGGEARRLLLARAILSGRDLILADEPTADLDRETAARIIAAQRDLNAEGCTVIVATHNPDLAVAMGRQVELVG